MTRKVKVSAHGVASHFRSAPRRKSLIANSVHRDIGAYDHWSERVCESAACDTCHEIEALLDDPVFQITCGIVH